MYKKERNRAIVSKVFCTFACRKQCSGLVGSVVDSMIFLTLAFGSLDYLFGQVLGKFWMSLLGGAILWMWRHRRVRQEALARAL